MALVDSAFRKYQAFKIVARNLGSLSRHQARLMQLFTFFSTLVTDTLNTVQKLLEEQHKQIFGQQPA